MFPRIKKLTHLKLVILDFNAKTGEDITTKINRIPLDCHAQGYDNGSNMCSKVKEVKTRIWKKINQALFSTWCAFIKTCWCHNTAKICPDVVTFYGDSPARWAILTN
ncbi:hypothetical protein PR048_001347 [Dryococelus australis]|uniref:Uncharacterized protein n=1 Tax=Dryococelus australis TaxID=614101 RepID=A0ABQ9IH72_9NEOP|nr:hypothetical protein PR048_001347 [Dryococelus australis]